MLPAVKVNTPSLRRPAGRPAKPYGRGPGFVL